MNDVWIFSVKDARVKRVEDSELHQYKGLEGVVINPDLSRVQGLSPHEWKLVGDQVFPKDNVSVKVEIPSQAYKYPHLELHTFEKKLEDLQGHFHKHKEETKLESETKKKSLQEAFKKTHEIIEEHRKSTDACFLNQAEEFFKIEKSLCEEMNAGFSAHKELVDEKELHLKRAVAVTNQVLSDHQAHTTRKFVTYGIDLVRLEKSLQEHRDRMKNFLTLLLIGNLLTAGVVTWLLVK